MTTPDDTPLLKLVGTDEDPSSLGRAVLRLAHLAAAQHRQASAVSPATGGAVAMEWRGLKLTDSAGHGRPAISPIARLGGSEATEGDR
ncbi:MAG: hypothetical protein AAGC44_02940 [Planctomycetota bacterium]